MFKLVGRALSEFRRAVVLQLNTAILEQNEPSEPVLVEVSPSREGGHVYTRYNRPTGLGLELGQSVSRKEAKEIVAKYGVASTDRGWELNPPSELTGNGRSRR